MQGSRHKHIHQHVMNTRKKYYVVWEGRDTGVFDSWDECREQIEGFPDAKYKSFSSQEAAIEAYRGKPSDHIGLIKSIAAHTPDIVNPSAIQGVENNAIAVDAACSRNPGPVEYRGVDLRTGAQIFHVGPMAGGSNNIGEFLAIVHALALLQKEGKHDTVIYSDSKTALSWVRKRKANTQITATAKNACIMGLLARAEQWLQTHQYRNKLLKWQTEEWGEIPADFGRK